MRKQKVMYNIISNLVLQIIILFYGFIVPKIIISNFGSDVNGLISSITQFLSYIALLESGFGPVVKAILYKPIAEKNKKTIADILKSAEKFFRRIALIFILYIAVLCLLYPLLVNKEFEWSYTLTLIVIIGMSTFAEYFFGMTYRLYLQAEQKMYITSIIQIVTYISSVIFITILASIGANIHVIKLVSGLIFILRPLLQNFYVKRKYNITFENINKKFEIKQKWDGMAQHIAYVIHSNTDITILTIFVNLAEVSVYSIYYLVVKGVKTIVQSFSAGIDASFGDMLAKGEQENLRKKFNLYEIMYYIIITIAFTSTIVLITPFVSVYTKGITDANYIRYLFGYLIVISEYIWAIRLPYSSITLAAGHFKETRIGAWVECISNLLISIILVFKYGIIGVAIGTIVAMTIRTCEFVYHTNKYILYRPIWASVKKILLIVVETIAIVCISRYLPFVENISYFNWVINAIMVGMLACVTTIVINFIFYKDSFKELFLILKNIFIKKKALKEAQN